MSGIQKYSKIMRNTIPNRIDVVIYLKSVLFLEKFVNTDIEISENKKPIRNFRLGCSKAFYVRLPRILKGNQNTKEKPKELLIAGKSGKIHMPFHKLAEIKAGKQSLHSKFESFFLNKQT